MATPEQAIKTLLGDITFQIAMLQSENENLKARIAELENETSTGSKVTNH